MTRSLSLLIQIVLHAVPATLMGVWISRWFFAMTYQSEWDSSFRFVPLYMLFLGCFVASAALVSIGSGSILSGSRRYATFCAFGVPFLGALLWLALHARGDLSSSVWAAIFGSAISCVLTLPLQAWFAPRVATWCKNRIAKRQALAIHLNGRDPFATPLLVMLHALPGCYLALFAPWASGDGPSVRAALLVCGGFVLAASLWVNTLNYYLRGSSAVRKLAVGAVCGVLVPLFAAIAIAIWYQGLPAGIALSLSFGRIVPLLMFTIPARAILTTMATTKELKLKVLKPSHA